MKERIIELVKQENCTYKLLKKKIKAESKKELDDTLKNMEVEEEIFLNEEGVYIEFPKNYQVGKIQYGKSSAYITFYDGSIQYIREENLNGAFNYDTVVLNKDNCSVIKILARELSQIVCEVKIKDGIKYLKPYHTIGDIKLRIDSNNMKHLEENDRIIVDVSLEKMDDYFEGFFLKKIGKANEPDIDQKTIALNNGFEIEFNEECLEQLKTIPQEVTFKDLKDRLDLRKKEIFTIDGENTKDMDDAISLEILKNGNYLLGVHIADVSHYIKKETPLYESAKNRGTSLYMQDSVIPMLPSEISNGICSLNPHVDRLTISCIMEIDKTGEIKDYRICKSVIHSKKKMSYENVNKVLDENEETPSDYKEFEKTLNKMQKLSKIITERKEERGYLRFANQEIECIQNKNGEVIEIKKRSNGTAQELIENFMITANACIATHLGWLEFMPSIYRNHARPNMDKVNNTLDYISSLGYRIRTIKNTNSAIVLQKILHQLSNKEEFPILSTLILKSMQKAAYSTDNLGHFALELPFYTHFTSPIRRFPDLTVHQILKMHTNENLEKIDLNELEKELQEICYHSSVMERQADLAENESQKLKLIEYIKNHIGEYFDGFITDIHNNEIDFQTSEGVPGIIDPTSIPKNMKYNAEKHCLIGEKHQITLKIGHHLGVKTIGIDQTNHLPIFAYEENLSLLEKNEKRLSKKIS